MKKDKTTPEMIANMAHSIQCDCDCEESCKRYDKILAAAILVSEEEE